MLTIIITAAIAALVFFALHQIEHAKPEYKYVAYWKRLQAKMTTKVKHKQSLPRR